MFSLKAIKNILEDPNPLLLENLAQEAHLLTKQYFGKTISLYAPLYLSNYCNSHCTYCGFSVHNKIHRLRLTPQQMEIEMTAIANSGIRNILLLTGESYKATGVPYLTEAAKVASRYFPNISLEVQPMEEEEYHELFVNGVDGITIYQETYNRQRYSEIHLAGKKKDYDYRFHTPERIAKSGIRHISLGILLGLWDVAEDLLDLFEHLHFLEKNFPGVEYSLSFPRLRPIKGMGFSPVMVDDKTLIKAICLARISFPRVGINLSTRESPHMRDHAIEIGVTRLSAASKTAVGGYALLREENQDPQFDIQDKRSVEEIVQMLKRRGFDPIFTDWRRIPNDISI